MSTHALPHVTRPNAGRLTVAPAVTHWLWLAGGLALGFSIPFLLADVLELNRDLYYGLYAAAVVGYVGAWATMTGQSVRRLVSRRLGLAVALGIVAGAILTLMIYRTEDSTPRPDGIELAAAIVWRGVVYGAVDGLLLSVFPILVVFAAFAGTKLRERAARYGRRRADRPRGLTGDDCRLPRGLQRLPRREASSTGCGRRRLERTDAADAQPGRAPIAHAAMHTAGRRPQLRDGHVPAASQRGLAASPPPRRSRA